MSALWRPAYRLDNRLGWRVLSPEGWESVLLFPVREIRPGERPKHPRGRELSCDPSCRDPSPAWREGQMKGCRALTEAEVALVQRSFGGTYAARDKALFLLGVKSGFRISELLSLRVADVQPHA